MRHLRKQAAPEALIEVGRLNAPSDRSKSGTVVFDVVDNETLTSSVRISDQSTAHAWSKPGEPTVLSVECVLCWVVLRRIYGQTTWYGRAWQLSVCGEARWCGSTRRSLFLVVLRFAQECFASCVHFWQARGG